MKSVIFIEEQLQNLNEIGKDLFSDEQDPRSSNYVRILKRPQISWVRIILYFLMPAIVITALIITLKYFNVSTTMTVILAITVFTGISF